MSTAVMPLAPLTEGMFKLSFKALGTQCLVQFRAPDVDMATGYRRAALEWVRQFEATFSRFIPTSALSRVNASAGLKPVRVSREFEDMLDLGGHVYSLSAGINDATSLPLTLLWDRAAERQAVPSASELSRCRDLVGWGKLERGEGWVRLPLAGMALDFGGFGKEFAVDRLLSLAIDHGISHVLVDLGRDIATHGCPPDQPAWVVGLEDAGLQDRSFTRIAVSGQAVASSGNYRRFRLIQGHRYGHLIDPRTGEPANTSVGAVSCVARRCLTAGIFCQAAFILGEDDGLRLLEAQREVAGLIQTPPTR
jgi:FAD:protein FMN transferase